MCKEDVRLARKAAVVGTYSANFIASPQLIFNANPNRYAVTLNVNHSGGAAAPDRGFLAAKVGGVYVPVIGYHAHVHGGNVSILDVGSLLTYDLYIFAIDSTNTVSIQAADMAFLQSLDGL